MPCASAQIAWLQRLLMRFLIRDLYRLDFGNITELIKMIGNGERGRERARDSCQWKDRRGPVCNHCSDQSPIVCL